MEKQIYGDDKRIKQLIDEHEVISFDIFDTLLMRKTLIPHDVFRIVEKRVNYALQHTYSFFDARVKAELDLIDRIPNIYELYDEIRKTLEITECEARRILELELAVEHEMLGPRNGMVKVFNYAIEKGKTVNIVSDTHIPKKVLEGWLDGFGVRNYNQFYVSCEYHKSKATGIFEEYRSNYKDQKCLHIGDSVIYDGEMAEKYGIDAYIIDSAKYMLEKTNLICLEKYESDFSNRCAIGLLINTLFTNPFSSVDQNGLVQLGSLEDLAILSVAPILSDFVFWISEQMKEQNLETIILSARDGYLLDKMMLRITGGVAYNHKYILFSRVAGNVMTINEKEDFRQSMRRPREMSFSDCIRQRLEIDGSTVEEERFFDLNKDKIQSQSMKFREKYLSYIKNEGIDLDKRIGFFDFVSSGTCHQLYNKISGNNAVGLYFYRYDRSRKDRSELVVKSYLTDEEGQKFWKNYKFFETVLTSSKPCFLRIDSDGKKIFEDEKRSETQLSLLEKQQKMILQYFETIQRMYIGRIDKELLLDMADFISKENIVLNDVRKADLYLYDNFEGGKIDAFS